MRTNESNGKEKGFVLECIKRRHCIARDLIVGEVGIRTQGRSVGSVVAFAPGLALRFVAWIVRRLGFHEDLAVLVQGGTDLHVEFLQWSSAVENLADAAGGVISFLEQLGNGDHPGHGITETLVQSHHPGALRVAAGQEGSTRRAAQ